MWRGVSPARAATVQSTTAGGQESSPRGSVELVVRDGPYKVSTTSDSAVADLQDSLDWSQMSLSIHDEVCLKCSILLQAYLIALQICYCMLLQTAAVSSSVHKLTVSYLDYCERGSSSGSNVARLVVGTDTDHETDTLETSEKSRARTRVERSNSRVGTKVSNLIKWPKKEKSSSGANMYVSDTSQVWTNVKCKVVVSSDGYNNINHTTLEDK